MRLRIARGVHRLLTPEGAPGTGPGRELAPSLQALAWSPETDGITSVLRRAVEDDDLGDRYRWRIRRLIRHMPVVALIDAHPGMSSERPGVSLDPTEGADAAWERGERLTTIRVELPYVLPRENFVRALVASALGMVVSVAAAVLPALLDPNLWAHVGSVVFASVYLVVDNLRGHRGSDAGPDDLRTFADKPPSYVKRTSIGVAAGAVVTANLGNAVGVALSVIGGVVCAFLAVAVLTKMHHRRPAMGGRRRRARELTG
ncbi:hypothetical protein [Streptomyces gardneri]|uniref:hypothetical protein n=1 Tax=Streptomyces gardneri TaxID=66892 RepID=UPI00368F6558